MTGTVIVPDEISSRVFPVSETEGKNHKYHERRPNNMFPVGCQYELMLIYYDLVEYFMAVVRIWSRPTNYL